MVSRKRVAIIGAGSSGLTAIKTCKEEGLEAVCFETTDHIGGLWRYHDDAPEGLASVMKSTVINTSKEIGAFSDFPPPKEFPNFMHNRQMFEYFKMYAEHFRLLDHIRMSTEVLKVEPSPDFDKTMRWIVTTRDIKSDTTNKEEFDGVMVCIGHHVYPKIPTFPGQEKFKGTITHTHSLKSCEKYAGQNVVVVGIGNSGTDAAVDATYTANQVYLSTRRGTWIFGRFGKDGYPYDISSTNSRRRLMINKFYSYDTICSVAEKRVQQRLNHDIYHLRPKHRIFAAHPTVNESLPHLILCGRVIVKGDVSRFEEDGVVFEGENEVTRADAVVLATGYYIRFPFLDQKILSTEANQVHLYKHAIHPRMPTLAIIALTQPIGPIFPVAEMQSRWFVQLLAGKAKLPSLEVMEKDIRFKQERNAKRYVASTRHTVQVDLTEYLDEISDLFGVKPNLLKLAVTDPKLFWVVFTGPCLPYHYRLNGPHAWRGARKTILNYEERVLAPFKTRKLNVSVQASRKKFSFRKPMYAALMLIFVWGLVKRRYLMDRFWDNTEKALLKLAIFAGSYFIKE